MGRLIDIDLLLEDFDPNGTRNLDPIEIRSIIVQQPDVDAVPLELMEETFGLLDTIRLEVPTSCFSCTNGSIAPHCPSPFADCEEDCGDKNKQECKCRNCNSEQGLIKWRWKYADRYERLKATVERSK